MSIAWEMFTPVNALVGGVLIGLASGVFALFKGRIAGISGIVGGLLSRVQPGDAGWRVAFIAGLLLAPAAWQLFAPLPAMEIKASVGTLIFAGLLVGFGTRMASGCTSGHGVCGLSRFSVRSLVATLTFLTAGVVTVALVSQLS
jgi:uncharacterized membrane protein YedE/YeeE